MNNFTGFFKLNFQKIEVVILLDLLKLEIDSLGSTNMSNSVVKFYFPLLPSLTEEDVIVKESRLGGPV